MPTVDKKHFKYTKKGIEKAKDYAKKTGKKLKAQYLSSVSRSTQV